MIELESGKCPVEGCEGDLIKEDGYYHCPICGLIITEQERGRGRPKKREANSSTQKFEEN